MRFGPDDVRTRAHACPHWCGCRSSRCCRARGKHPLIHPPTHTVLLPHLEPVRRGAQGRMVQQQRPLLQPYTRRDAAAEGRAQAGPVRVACCCCRCDERLPGRAGQQAAGRQIHEHMLRHLSVNVLVKIVSHMLLTTALLLLLCPTVPTGLLHAGTQAAAACLLHCAHLSVVKGFGHQAASRACTSSAPGFDSW